MASLINAISKLVYGDDNFCHLCLRNVEEGKFHIEDEVTIEFSENTTHTEEIREMLRVLLGREWLDNIFKTGALCDECVSSVANSYKFVKMCRENSNNLSKAIDSVIDSVENASTSQFMYSTLYVSLDTTDFKSKCYMDDLKVNDYSAAHKRFVTVSSKPKLKCNDDNTIAMKNKNDILSKNERNTIVYDIPTVPTTDIIYNPDKPTNLKCKACLKYFRETTSLRHHYFKSHYPRNVKCSKCPKTFISQDMLRHHDNENHRQLFCSQCGKHFTSKYVLRTHEANHYMKITCHRCGRVYRSKIAFNKHIADDICSQKMRKSSSQGAYFCDYCNKSFCYKPYLAKHIKYEHENAEGFRCTFCQKNFYTPSQLQTHIVKHTLEKKFICSECGGRFVSKASLLYHTRLHTGEKPYQCDYCEMAFLSASRRIDHVRRHHMAPSLECDICHSKFKGTGSLLKHRKRHFNPKSRLNYRYLLKEQEQQGTC